MGMRILLLLAISLISLNIYGQNNNSKISKAFLSVAKILKELDKEVPINNIKHVNQIVGYKDGIWIESNRNELWVYNYKMGVKDGYFFCINISTEKKEVEGEYKNGFLSGTLKMYDADGKYIQIYRDIKRTKYKKNIAFFAATKNGEDFKRFKKDVVFQYRAKYEKYTREGKIYKSGIGVFNDIKSYEIVDSVGYRSNLSLYRVYDMD